LGPFIVDQVEVLLFQDLFESTAKTGAVEFLEGLIGIQGDRFVSTSGHQFHPGAIGLEPADALGVVIALNERQEVNLVTGGNTTEELEDSSGAPVPAEKGKIGADHQNLEALPLWFGWDGPFRSLVHVGQGPAAQVEEMAVGLLAARFA
jgi:hypothetical protein